MKTNLRSGTFETKSVQGGPGRERNRRYSKNDLHMVRDGSVAAGISTQGQCEQVIAGVMLKVPYMALQ